MVTGTGPVVGEDDGKAWPAGTWSAVGPKPTPNSTRGSPAETGRVGYENAPVGPTILYEPSGFTTTAAMCFESSRLNDGLSGLSPTVETVVPAGVVTATVTDPCVVSSGACTLICPGLTNHR